MNSMYANRVTITVNDSECFMKFDYIAPKYGEENEIKGPETRESQEIVMDIEALKRIHETIVGLIGDKQEQK